MSTKYRRPATTSTVPSTSGNRAPMVLGNRFELLEHSAYSDAIGNFVLANCGKCELLGQRAKN